MDNPNDVASTSLLSVLLALKSNIMKALHVAELYSVYEIIPTNDGSGNELYKTYKCVAINNKQRFVYCLALKDLEIQSFDVVLVLFCDEDYIMNYKRIKAGESKQDTSSKTKHTLQYGIIVGVV